MIKNVFKVKNKTIKLLQYSFVKSKNDTKNIKYFVFTKNSLFRYDLQYALYVSHNLCLIKFLIVTFKFLNQWPTYTFYYTL